MRGEVDAKVDYYESTRFAGKIGFDWRVRLLPESAV